MFRSLRYQGCRAEVRAQARAGGRQPFSIYTDRRPATMGGMRAPMVVEGHPVADPLAGLPPAREGMQIDALVFQRAPQPLDKDVVGNRPRPSIEMRTLASLRCCVQAQEVNWLPWSVLKISGGP